MCFESTPLIFNEEAFREKKVEKKNLNWSTSEAEKMTKRVLMKLKSFSENVPFLFLLAQAKKAIKIHSIWRLYLLALKKSSSTAASTENQFGNLIIGTNFIERSNEVLEKELKFVSSNSLVEVDNRILTFLTQGCFTSTECHAQLVKSSADLNFIAFKASNKLSQRSLTFLLFLFSFY